MSKNISIIGLGYVGLPLALLAEAKGYQVQGIDIDQNKVNKINDRISPFKDEEISDELKKSNLKATTNFEILQNSSIVVICVPTPVYADYTPNLEPVKSAAQKIGENLKSGQLIILESTVNPGVSDEIVIPLIEKVSGLKVGADFMFAHCPERIDPGNSQWNVKNINRVVGGYDASSLQAAVEFYESLIIGTVKQMTSLKEAEAVKIVENSFRDINIAFVNELARSFSVLGIDLVNVINGAATKPFAFMAHYPGCGVGGHCIPVDPYYLIEYAKNHGFEHDFLSLARRINNQMPKFTVDQTLRSLNEIELPMKNTRIAVLGLAYKPEVGDLRESPAVIIIKLLKESGAQVTAFDPFIPEMSNVKTLPEALNKAAAVVIVTAHKIFKELTPDILKSHGIKVVIDGRNCLDKDKFLAAGLVYRGIGR